MIVRGILSNTKAVIHRSYQIVFAWEQIISQKYPMPIISIKKREHWILRKINRLSITRNIFLFLNKIYPENHFYIYFAMIIELGEIRIEKRKNVLPVIIDYWLTDDRLPDFYDYFSLSRCVLITSKEIYDHLLSKNCPLRIAHFPLSIPDSDVEKEYLFQPKEFSFLFGGRKNLVFWEYVQQYEKECPEIEYVYQELDGLIPYYISNKRGRINGDFSTREGYINLLRKSKICFYATPGMDKEHANGFNQVTPRFLELIASGCLVMGKYISNPDTEYYNLEKYCPCINSYEDFIKTISLFMDGSWSQKHIATYYEYLQKHVTSARIPLLRDIINTIQ